MNGIGILPGNHPSYIDHLVPLCHLLQIPVLVTDIKIQHLIEQYYPPIEIICVESADFNLDPYLAPYDFLVYVDFFRKGNGTFQFQEYISRKKKRAVMGLHGHPDKFWSIYWLEHLCDEDIILIYGPLLQKLLYEKGITKRGIICGNVRLDYYKKHEAFFDHKLPFHKTKPIVLYAPTWSASGRLTEHKKHYSSFWEVYREVFVHLPERYQLIVKLHPQLIQVMPDKVEALMAEFPHIYFLEDFPLIYPLLKQVDVYLGDYSSIGYDFLYFDKPLYFLENYEMSVLQNYGKRITRHSIAQIGLEEDHFSRKELYCQVFSEPDSMRLKQEIENACRSPT